MNERRIMMIVIALAMAVFTVACGAGTNNTASPNQSSGGGADGSAEAPVHLFIPTMDVGTWPYISTETLTPFIKDALPPGSTVERAPSSTGDINGLYLLQADQGDLYLVSDLPAHWVWEGKDYPTIDKPYQDFRKLIQTDPYAGFGLLISKKIVDEHQLKSVDDLFSKNIKVSMATFPAGSSSGIATELILKNYGYEDLSDFEKQGNTLLQGAPSDIVKYVKDRQADMYFGLIIGHDFPIIEEMSSSLDMVILPFGEESLSSLAEEYGFSSFLVPADAYKGTEEDTTILGLGGYISVRSDMPDDVAYKLTKAIYENWDEIRKVDPFFSITPLNFRETIVPFHPGAEAYLKEAGALE